MSSWGAIVLAAVLVAAIAFGTWRSRTPKFRENDSFITLSAPNSTLSAGDLGKKATLVQFSTAFCQPCRATRRILDEVSTMVDGVQVIHIDAEDHLELVRQLDVRRTPTVFVLDANGDVVKRAVGLPRKADVIAAVGELA